MKVGYSGTRLGMTQQQLDELTRQLHAHGTTEFHHGDCQGGDEQAHTIARTLGVRIVGHPPTASGLRAFMQCDEERQPAEFLARNRNIVLETEILFATPDGPERLRSGTWATIRNAKRLGLPVQVIYPDGEVQIFDGHTQH